MERYEEIQALIDQLYEEAHRATEAMRNIDPDAAEVLINPKDFAVYHDRQIRIIRDIADELGQLPTRAQPDTSASKPHLFHTVEGIDLQKALGVVIGPRPVAEPIPVAEPVDLGSKDADMREPFRVMPPPPLAAPEPEPAVEEPVPVATATPVLPDSVVRAAKAIAIQIWSGGSRPRDRFFKGQNEAAQAETEAALAHAIDVGWIAVSGTQLVAGATNPNPMSSLPSENSRAWGPSRSR